MNEPRYTGGLLLLTSTACLGSKHPMLDEDMDKKGLRIVKACFGAGVVGLFVVDCMHLLDQSEQYNVAQIPIKMYKRSMLLSGTGHTLNVSRGSRVVPETMCFEHASGVKPDRQGQVLSTDTFGQALKKIAQNPAVRRIIEIGTWYGGGSTQAFVEGFGENNKCASNATHHCCERFIVTFEIYKPAYDHARLYHQDNPVWLVLGTTVGLEHMLKPDEIPDHEKGEHYSLYYERDKALLEAQSGQLEHYCALVKPDLVLIDGNEYTGWGEFQVVLRCCQPAWVALHDTNTLKTAKIEAFMKQHPESFTMVNQGKDAVGWAVYQVSGKHTRLVKPPD